MIGDVGTRIEFGLIELMFEATIYIHMIINYLGTYTLL